MSQIRSKDTNPELIVRKFLFAHGFRYRLHEKDLPGKPDAGQYSRIESGKTAPSVSTLERIAKVIEVSLSDLFASPDELKEINSYDKSIMEKVALVEALTKEEKHT